MTSIDDLLGGGGTGKTATFPTIGTIWEGRVVSAEPRQATDPKTSKPTFWDDGKPMMTAVVGIQTDDRRADVEGDDGVRFVYVKLWGEQKKAFRDAARKAGGSPEPGDYFTVKYIANGEQTNRAFDPPKLFEYDIKKVSAIDAVLAGPDSVLRAVPAAPASQATAPSTPAAPVVDAAMEAQIKRFIGISLDDDQIAAALSIFVQDVAAVRLQLAADSSKGF